VRVEVDLTVPPSAAFDVVVEELTSVLSRLGLRFEVGPKGGIFAGDKALARVVTWKAGELVTWDWWRPEWKPGEASRVEFLFEPTTDGTRVTVKEHGWAGLFDDQGGELAGWFASEVAAPLLAAMEPRQFGDWLTDRRARRPAGQRARETYRNPIYHRPNFLYILKELSLQPEDYLLEVGCGGGAFLHDALESGCKAAAIDHSPDMVKLAREVNRDAIAVRRLEILEGEAEQLPYPNGRFTCAVVTGVFGFLPNPALALSEVHRVLTEDGRFILFTSTEALRGTPAAPEPIASRLHFYSDSELKELARGAGFAEVRVERPNLEVYARQARVPEEHLSLFSEREGQFLVAKRH